MASEESCGICNVQLPNGSAARRHQAETQHLSDRYCPKCHKIFVDVRALGRHKKDKHSSLPLQQTTQSKDKVHIAATIQLAITSHQTTTTAHPAPSASTPAEPSPLALQTVTEHPKKKLKLEKEKPKHDGPIFTPPPVYPTIDVTESSTFPHGSNKYTLYSPFSQTMLLSALTLRVHPRDRLTKRKFIFPDEQPPDFKGRLSIGLDAIDFASSPVFSPLAGKRSAVVLDCEMVGVSHERRRKNGSETVERSELGQLVAVDFLTGEVLVDSLVSPTGHVMNWRSRYSGITYPAIKAARREGTLLLGWRAARRELFRYIDSETILIGHDLPNDLQMLRLKHGRYVDTSLQTSEAVFGTERFHRAWGLKELGKMLLDMKIQSGGSKGHDCLEDVLATREVAIWCIRFPDKLEAWAEAMRVQWEKDMLEQKKKQEEARKKREEERKKREAVDRVKQQAEQQREEEEKLALQAAVAKAKADYATDISASRANPTQEKAKYETLRAELTENPEETRFWTAMAKVKADFEADIAVSTAMEDEEENLVDLSTP